MRLLFGRGWDWTAMASHHPGVYTFDDFTLILAF